MSTTRSPETEPMPEDIRGWARGDDLVPDAARSVPCPTCHAVVDRPCVTFDIHSHAARIVAAGGTAQPARERWQGTDPVPHARPVTAAAALMAGGVLGLAIAAVLGRIVVAVMS